MQGIQPRNEEELLQRNEERLLQLGPPLERVHGEFLSRMVTRTFNQAVNAGIIPPAPEIIQRRNLEVRFISSLAMAQRSVATTAGDPWHQGPGRPAAPRVAAEADPDRCASGSGAPRRPSPGPSLNYLFVNGPAGSCGDGRDFNDDGAQNLGDFIYLASHLFLQGAPPPPPYPACGSVVPPFDCGMFDACP